MLKEFAEKEDEKDDNKEMTIALLRLTKVVKEENEIKEKMAARRAERKFGIDIINFEEEWRENCFKEKIIIQPDRIRLTKIHREMRTNLKESWKILMKRIDKRKSELLKENEG
jgi:hypothetical protein